MVWALYLELLTDKKLLDFENDRNLKIISMTLNLQNVVKEWTTKIARAQKRARTQNVKKKHVFPDANVQKERTTMVQVVLPLNSATVL